VVQGRSYFDDTHGESVGRLFLNMLAKFTNRKPFIIAVEDALRISTGLER
jgi:hypothetical protein